MCLLAACAAFAAVLFATFSGTVRPASAGRQVAAMGDWAEPGASSPSDDGEARRGRAAASRRVGNGDAFDCPSPRVTDGDTIRCGDLRVRLASIDAPEMPGHCRRGRACTPGDPHSSRSNLQRLVDAGPLSCVRTDVDRYGRTVATCSAAGLDLSCEQVAAGHAVERYGRLRCGPARIGTTGKSDG